MPTLPRPTTIANGTGLNRPVTSGLPASPRPPGAFDSGEQVRLEEKVGTRLYQLTNSAPYTIKFEGRVYPTAAHLFNAMKVCRMGRLYCGECF